MLEDTSYRYDTSRDLTSNLVGVLAALAMMAIASYVRKPTVSLWSLKEQPETTPTRA
jgi:hypothetical protein